MKVMPYTCYSESRYGRHQTVTSLSHSTDTDRFHNSHLIDGGARQYSDNFTASETAPRITAAGVLNSKLHKTSQVKNEDH